MRRYPPALLGTLLAPDPVVKPTHDSLIKDLAEHAVALSWLGHASVLCRIEHCTIAIDPVLSPRIGVRVARRTIGIERQTAAPIAAEALADVDLVLLTHAHFDHLDKPTLRAMMHPDTDVVVPTGCAKLIPAGFRSVHEMAAGDTHDINGITIRAIEPQHWGARTIVDRGRGVNSYLVQSRDIRVLFVGDTAATDVFDAIDDVRVAVFGIGAYEPWEHMHATPEQVWEMFSRLGGTYLLPIHYSTFRLSDEPMDEPLQRLLQAARNDRDRILDVAIGEVISIHPRET
ncbi:MAG: MBL fold metallo-hydrolase [Phycisphaerales bacterium]|nr:MBL fold metallo-hydrolase [Phycisphaerales bacterium]